MNTDRFGVIVKAGIFAAVIGLLVLIHVSNDKWHEDHPQGIQDDRDNCYVEMVATEFPPRKVEERRYPELGTLKGKELQQRMEQIQQELEAEIPAVLRDTRDYLERFKTRGVEMRQICASRYPWPNGEAKPE